MRTSFVGRQREVEEVAHLVASSRLVTLTGAAGCGKTRLALRVAQQMAKGEAAGADFADGTSWVELARLEEPALVAQAVARALGVAEQAERPAVEGVLEALEDREVLLVLDNCEHLLSACVQLTKKVLGETAASVLATSREPLNVTGERLYPVPPLTVPPASLPDGEVDGLAQFEAVQLFAERARAIRPAFNLTADNASAIADICRRLDGIPLAIELASARLNVLTAEQIAERLDDQFALLSPAGHVTTSHHETLRAAIRWSHDLLSEAEQILLRRLSVFAGGCSLNTVERVCAGEGVEPGQMVELLSSLVRKSLVIADTLQRSEARYTLLEPIRQYAGEKLEAAGERPAMRDRHLQCFVELAEETEPKLKGQYQQLWLEWLEGEYDNVRAALGWALESGRVEEGLRMSVALYQFWTIRDYVEEGLAWLERLLAQADEGIAAGVRANALAYATFLAGFRGNTAARIAHGHEAAALVESLREEDKSALAWALAAQGFGARAAGDYDTEFAIGQELIDLHRELGQTYQLGLALSLYTVPAMAIGEYDAAREMLDEGLPLLRDMGDPYRIAMALNYSGDLARCEGEYARAQGAYEESLSLLQEIDAVRDRASVLHNLGHACLHLGEDEQARALFRESVALHEEQGNRPGMSECLIGFAGLALTGGLPTAGAHLLAAAEALGGQHVTSEWAATRLEYERYREQAHEALTQKEFEREWAAGRTLSLEQAVAFAEEVAQKAAVAQETREEWDKLTPREQEVAALIARARSNDEIADELVISKRTVETHISNIRSKLGFTKRTQIVRWALDAGLVTTRDRERP